MDEPRRSPPPYPPLALRQRGNAISVRQKPDQDNGWGTLQNPKRFELSIAGTVQLKSHLGFEAVPASEFWQFQTPGRVRLLVHRRSADRYASSVGVALLNSDRRRVASLVSSARGEGTPVDLPAGTYVIVASLGLAESLKDLVFEVSSTPIGGALATASLMAPASAAAMLYPGSSAQAPRAAAAAAAGGMGQLNNPQLRSGLARGLRSRRPLTPLSVLGAPVLRGAGIAQTVAAAMRHPGGAAPLKSIAATPAARGSAQLTPVLWRHLPYEPWHGRVAAAAVELNSEYVRFTGRRADDAALLAQLQQSLSNANPS